jgi:GDPmannose 4,6-dehydratase
MAFRQVGVELEFSGNADNEKGFVVSAVDQEHFPLGKEVVCVDPKYYRPTEVDLLIGDASKAKTKLGWEPKYTLEDMVKEMVTSDLELFRRNQILKEAGFNILNQHE